MQIQEGNMSQKMTDAVDYRGFPADKSKTGGWVPAALILGIEICERLTTMGIAVNLVTYLIGTMHLPSAESANIVTDFMGTSFILCLLGGFLADSFLGRYLTILIFTAVQLTGTAMLTVVSKLPQLRPPPCKPGEPCEPASKFQRFMFFLSLYIISLGIGGLKSSVSGFGADQFDENDEKEKTQMSYFFNRFFLFISTGTLVAVTVLVYIQDEVGRSLAYAICCAAMAAALCLFLSGTKKYRYKTNLGSPLLSVLQVVVAAFRKRKLFYNSGDRFFNGDQEQGKTIHPSNQFRFLNRAAMMEDGEIDGGMKGEEDGRRISWRLCSVRMVEEVKMMMRLVPVWTTTIMFWTVYAQMITFSVEQASTMDRSVGRSFQIPAGSFTVFFVGTIIVTLAVYDRLVMPWWKKYRGSTGFTCLQKIGIGLLISAIGMAAAAAVESKRLAVARRAEAPTKTASPTGSSPENALPMSAFTLVPQFLLVGAAEAFVYTGQLDFFITRSPKGMKTMSTGIFLSTISLGFFVSSLLVTAVKKMTEAVGKPWLADSINGGRLDCFYGLLAVLSVLNWAGFICWAVKRGKDNEEDEC